MTHQPDAVARSRAFILLATALSPWAGAALADSLGGYPVVFAVLAAISVAAAVLALATRPERPS